MNEGSQQENLNQLMMKVQAERIRRAFIFFRDNEIEPILIKGWAIARFYPNPLERTFSDVDLAISPEFFSKAEELLTVELKGQLQVDLHNSLRKLDTVAFDDLFANSELVELNDFKVRVLRHEDHLRVLAIHWLIDGGVLKNRLWDIYYALENRPENFDWKRFLNIVEKNRRDWIVATIALAHRYLNLNVEGTPVEKEIKNPAFLPKWLIRTVENEWENPVKPLPMHMARQSPLIFWQQLKKRFPPNPIQASIETNAPLSNFPRLPYQMANFFQRLKPSLNRNKDLFRFK